MSEAVQSGKKEVMNGELLMNGFWRNNPVFVQVLGMCPVLAVTNSVMNSLVMGLASTFVLLMSNIFVSLLRSFIPKQVRIATYILIIATFVTVVDYVIMAISIEVHKNLGAFISLIVVNCMILGRAEAFASKNTIRKSIVDALGMGAGFTFAVLCLGVVREVIGNGTFLEIPVFGKSFEPWVIMILPGGAFFVLAGWLMLFSYLRERRRAREATT